MVGEVLGDVPPAHSSFSLGAVPLTDVAWSSLGDDMTVLETSVCAFVSSGRPAMFLGGLGPRPGLALRLAASPALFMCLRHSFPLLGVMAPPSYSGAHSLLPPVK